MASHHEGESWGLDVIPEDNMILTSGDDNKVMIFDYANRKFLREGKVSFTNQPREEEKSK
jgi:hypothetical protein